MKVITLLLALKIHSFYQISVRAKLRKLILYIQLDFWITLQPNETSPL